MHRCTLAADDRMVDSGPILTLFVFIAIDIPVATSATSLQTACYSLFARSKRLSTGGQSQMRAARLQAGCLVFRLIMAL